GKCGRFATASLGSNVVFPAWEGSVSRFFIALSGNLTVEQMSDFGKDLLEHGGRQTPCLRVVSAAMVTVKKRQPVSQAMARAMSKFVRGGLFRGRHQY